MHFSHYSDSDLIVNNDGGISAKIGKGGGGGLFRGLGVAIRLNPLIAARPVAVIENNVIAVGWLLSWRLAAYASLKSLM